VGPGYFLPASVGSSSPARHGDDVPSRDARIERRGPIRCFTTMRRTTFTDVIEETAWIIPRHYEADYIVGRLQQQGRPDIYVATIRRRDVFTAMTEKENSGTIWTGIRQAIGEEDTRSGGHGRAIGVICTPGPAFAGVTNFALDTSPLYRQRRTWDFRCFLPCGRSGCLRCRL